MRYRVLAILVALMAVAGLSAQSALASSSPGTGYKPSTTGSCSSSGRLHIFANDNGGQYGITYPSVGSQATITDTPGFSYVHNAGTSGVYCIYNIKNSNGRCLRMRSSGSHAVIEESGCAAGDKSELFRVASNGSLARFKNIGTHAYLGVSCPAENGNKVWGYTSTNGTCIDWALVAA